MHPEPDAGGAPPVVGDRGDKGDREDRAVPREALRHPQHPQRPPSRWWAGGGTAALVLIASVYGLLLRGWVLTHVVLNSDEAVVGLMARGALAGHFATFYWGQQYGGAEEYVVAAVLWLVHGSPEGIGATAAALSAVAAVAVGLVVAGVTGNRRLGTLAGALAWVWPYAVVWNSLREGGFRGVTAACGLLALYAAVRIQRGGHGVGTSVLLGLAVGLGWWSSPEIGYFAVPVVVLLAASWDRLFAGRRWRARRWRPVPALAAVGAAFVGALPWIYTNLHTGFASLSTGSLPEYGGIGYGGRLSVFFRDMLPMQLGVRTVPGGAWSGGDVVGPVLYGLVGAAIVAALVRAGLAARRGRCAAPLVALAAGVVAFPLVYALVPATGYWADGRYGVELPPLLAVLMALALVGPVRRPATAESAPGGRTVGGRKVGGRGAGGRAARVRTAGGRTAGGRAVLAVACAGVAAGGLLTMSTAGAGGVPTGPRALVAGWTDPEAPVRHVTAEMTRHGIRYAYGDYWTAYVLDVVDPDGVVVSPSPLDVVRWEAEAAAVRAAPDPAWLFFAPGRAVRASQAFGNPEPGPGNYTEVEFESLLRGLGVPYRVVHLGVLDAVVPARRVALPAP